MLRAARIASSGSRSCGAPRSEVRHRGWAPRPNQGPLSAAPSLSACRDTASPPPINPHALTLQSVARCQSAAPARAPREVRAKSRSGGGSEQVLRTKNLSTNSDCLLCMRKALRDDNGRDCDVLAMDRRISRFPPSSIMVLWFCTLHSARLD